MLKLVCYIHPIQPVHTLLAPNFESGSYYEPTVTQRPTPTQQTTTEHIPTSKKGSQGKKPPKTFPRVERTKYVSKLMQDLTIHLELLVLTNLCSTNPLPETDELASKPLEMEITKFLKGPDNILNFPNTLTSNERRIIHEVSYAYGKGHRL